MVTGSPSSWILLVSAIEQLLLRARAATVRQRSFAADAAHEQRTPLAAMQIHAEALGQHALAPDVDPHIAGWDVYLRTANRAAAQLLAYFRSESQQQAGPLQAVDLLGLVQDRLAAAEPAATERRVELELSVAVEAWVVDSADGLQALVDNLVE